VTLSKYARSRAARFNPDSIGICPPETAGRRSHDAIRSKAPVVRRRMAQPVYPQYRTNGRRRRRVDPTLR
jgi:hypothetical protein